MTEQFGLLCIGNAIVDILSPVSDELIAAQEAHGMKRNAMNLIDPKRAQEIYELMSSATETSGGSACNTAACYGSFGGKGAFIGLTANDQFGQIFSHDIHAQKIHYSTPPLENGVGTARSYILVTPDGHRTMNTYLGACVHLNPTHIDEGLVKSSAITYLEGFLFDEPQAKQAFITAADLTHKYQRKIALTLSDTFCVERHRSDFLSFIRERVDILFANELELISLYQTNDLDEAIQKAKKDCKFVVVTMGPQGSQIITEHETVRVHAEPTQVVDTTGAGDSYAAGVLFGLSQNLPLKECARLGSIAAAEVISHFGPRPLTSLASLIPADLKAA